MKYYVDTTQRWKLSKIKELLYNNSLDTAEWQRLEKSEKRRKGPVELINAIINETLLPPWVFSDLKSNLNYAKYTGNIKDENYFKDFIYNTIENEITGVKKTTEKLYSIEDSFQRITDLKDVKDEHFKNDEEKRIFWDSEVSVFILYNCSVLKLVEVFTRTNDGITLTTEEKLWGYPSPINIELKSSIIQNDWVDHLYTKKKTNESVRDMYKNLKKILMVCGYNDQLNSYGSTDIKNVKLFTKNENETLLTYDKIINEFQIAIPYLETYYKTKKSIFSHQAKMTFIIHIMNKKNITITAENILAIMSNFTDTRKKAESWYKNIESFIVENYG